jgi:hypothetical protein
LAAELTGSCPVAGFDAFRHWNKIRCTAFERAIRKRAFAM